MNRREFLRTALGGAALAIAPQVACSPRAASGRTNVLLITADDMNWDSPSCYGGCADDVTPNIDRLAREGMRFDRAHVTIAVCAPSRTVLMTGRYPHRNEAVGFQGVSPDVPLLTESLARAGYLRGILGKVRHLKPRARYHWDVAVRRDHLGEGRDAAAYAREARAFFREARRDGRPFFLMANTIDPHRPFDESLQEVAKYGPEASDIARPSRVYAPSEVRLPGFLPDLPPVRKEVAQYCSSVRRCDDVVGALLRELDDAGMARDTLVVFLSDNGMAFPFSKGNCYLNSTRVPWIVRWPGHVAPGSVERDDFVSGIDLAPTLLEALALPPLPGMDGRSFLPLLEGGEQAGRDEVFTVFHEDRLRNRFPMRCVQDRRFGYIYNGWADGKTRFHSEGHKGLTLHALELAARSDAELARRLELLMHRKPEELYDFAADPDARHDLADDPTQADTKARFRARLLAWMQRTGDPLEPTYRTFLAGASG